MCVARSCDTLVRGENTLPLHFLFLFLVKSFGDHPENRMRSPEAARLGCQFLGTQQDSCTFFGGQTNKSTTHAGGAQEAPGAAPTAAAPLRGPVWCQNILPLHFLFLFLVKSFGDHPENRMRSPEAARLGCQILGTQQDSCTFFGGQTNKSTTHAGGAQEAPGAAPTAAAPLRGPVWCQNILPLHFLFLFLVKSFGDHPENRMRSPEAARLGCQFLGTQQDSCTFFGGQTNKSTTHSPIGLETSEYACKSCIAS